MSTDDKLSDALLQLDDWNRDREAEEMDEGEEEHRVEEEDAPSDAHEDGGQRCATCDGYVPPGAVFKKCHPCVEVETNLASYLSRGGLRAHLFVREALGLVPVVGGDRRPDPSNVERALTVCRRLADLDRPGDLHGIVEEARDVLTGVDPEVEEVIRRRSTPWPIMELLTRLTQGSEILLRGGYDAHGYETLVAACAAGRESIRRILRLGGIDDRDVIPGGETPS